MDWLDVLSHFVPVRDAVESDEQNGGGNENGKRSYCLDMLENGSDKNLAELYDYLQGQKTFSLPSPVLAEGLRSLGDFVCL